MSHTHQYLAEASEIIQKLDTAAIDQIVALLVALRERGGRLFILGVGGSAANASHAVNDFRKIWTEGTLQAVAPYRDRMQIAVPGTEVVPGVTAMSVAGHSAGMCGYIFENGGEKVIFTGDLAHHQVYDPIHPEWFFHMDYDTDPLQGAAAKAEVFAEVTRHGIRYHGYHFPWPGLGVMAAQGDGTYLFHADLPTPRL